MGARRGTRYAALRLTCVGLVMAGGALTAGTGATAAIAGRTSMGIPNVAATPTPSPTPTPRPKAETTNQGLRVSVAKKTTAERTDERLRRAEAEKHESSAKRNVLRTHTTGERPYEPKSKICISDAQHPAAQGGCLKVTPDRPRIEDVTREVVFRTVRDERVVTFPSSPVHVQPRGWTLVNLETNVYAEQRYVDRTVTVLTWPVEVRANPASYTSGTPHCIRRADTNLTVADKNGEVHHDGQIWSRALYDINKGLGREKANKVIIEAQFNFAPDTNFAAAANATVAAAQALYGSTDAATVRAAFQARGIL